MDWVEFALARQLLVEELIGTRLRAARREEDDDFDATVQAAAKEQRR